MRQPYSSDPFFDESDMTALSLLSFSDESLTSLHSEMKDKLNAAALVENKLEPRYAATIEEKDKTVEEIDEMGKKIVTYVENIGAEDKFEKSMVSMKLEITSIQLSAHIKVMEMIVSILKEVQFELNAIIREQKSLRARAFHNVEMCKRMDLSETVIKDFEEQVSWVESLCGISGQNAVELRSSFDDVMNQLELARDFKRYLEKLISDHFDNY